ncbi:MAG: hypothetical protein JSV00_00665 [bacterium]|nr:MAG: hypothetical protein JSV00_00665 [bacterium]
MPSAPEAHNWKRLAEELGIRLPERFLLILDEALDGTAAWQYLSAAEAVGLKAELDRRFDYPGRQWRGIPFARSRVCEDVACFDLATPRDREAQVIPVRDWHGPRWEFARDLKTFHRWLTEDREGHLT